MKKRGVKPRFGVAMKRKAVTFDEMTLRKGKALAQVDGVSFSQIVRDAISEKYDRYQRDDK